LSEILLRQVRERAEALSLSDSQRQELAELIHEMILELKGLARCRKMVRIWCQEWNERRAAQYQFRRELGKHARKIFSNRRLRRKTKKPPEAGWTYRAMRRIHAKKDHIFETRVFFGWVPPNLRLDMEPQARLPFPLPEDALSLQEKYAAITAVHDTNSDGCDKYFVCDEIKEEPLLIAYKVLLGNARLLKPRDVPHLKSVMMEIRNDLMNSSAASQAADNQPVSSPKKKRGRPKQYNAYKDNKIYNKWDSKKYKRYKDLAAQENLSPLEVARAIERHRKRIARSAPE
jgi:hypothetical protein